MVRSVFIYMCASQTYITKAYIITTQITDREPKLYMQGKCSIAFCGRNYSCLAVTKEGANRSYTDGICPTCLAVIKKHNISFGAVTVAWNKVVNRGPKYGCQGCHYFCLSCGMKVEVNRSMEARDMGYKCTACARGPGATLMHAGTYQSAIPTCTMEAPMPKHYECGLEGTEGEEEDTNKDHDGPYLDTQPYPPTVQESVSVLGETDIGGNVDNNVEDTAASLQQSITF